MSRLAIQNRKRDYSKTNPIIKQEEDEQQEPQCLVIPSETASGGTCPPLVLIPCGSIGKRILYVECHDPEELAGFGLGPEVLSVG